MFQNVPNSLEAAGSPYADKNWCVPGFMLNAVHVPAHRIFSPISALPRVTRSRLNNCTFFCRQTDGSTCILSHTPRLRPNKMRGRFCPILCVLLNLQHVTGTFKIWPVTDISYTFWARSKNLNSMQITFYTLWVTFGSLQPIRNFIGRSVDNIKITPLILIMHRVSPSKSSASVYVRIGKS